MKLRVLFVLIFILFSADSFSQELTSKIVRVGDGDTFYLLDSNNKSVRIRLWGIDSPEKGQPYYKRSTEYFKKLTRNKVITFEIKGKDRYKRPLLVLYADSINVNEEMLRSGMAWQYKYNKLKRYTQLQSEAQKNKLNIWSHPNPIDPYLFRKSKKKN